jgi:hypothetical protein
MNQVEIMEQTAAGHYRSCMVCVLLGQEPNVRMQDSGNSQQLREHVI